MIDMSYAYSILTRLTKYNWQICREINILQELCSQSSREPVMRIFLTFFQAFLPLVCVIIFNIYGFFAVHVVHKYCYTKFFYSNSKVGAYILKPSQCHSVNIRNKIIAKWHHITGVVNKWLVISIYTRHAWPAMLGLGRSNLTSKPYPSSPTELYWLTTYYTYGIGKTGKTKM